jgi:hypothetical protein
MISSPPWPPAIPGISGAKKFAGRGFRRDAEKHTPEAVCSPERPSASVFDFGIRIEDLEGRQPARQLSEVGGGSRRTPQIKAGQPPLSSLRSALFRMNCRQPPHTVLFAPDALRSAWPKHDRGLHGPRWGLHGPRWGLHGPRASAKRQVPKGAEDGTAEGGRRSAERGAAERIRTDAWE